MRRLRKYIFNNYISPSPAARRIVKEIKNASQLYKDWRRFENGPPAVMCLEMTNICNANCVFCAYQYQDDFRRERGFMSDEIFKRALAGYKGVGGKLLSFAPIIGETLLDSKIIERIRYAKNQGFIISLFTNGILLHTIDLEDFIQSGLDVLILSTSPFDKKSHELIYRTPHYDDLLCGVAELLKRRKKLKSRLKLKIVFRSHMPYHQVVRLPDFQDKIKPFLNRQELDVMYVGFKDFDNCVGRISKDDLIDDMDLAKPIRYKIWPCMWSFGLMVLYDGKVGACPNRFSMAGHGKAGDELCLGVG
ncbi:MAG: radical SAM protein [Candidatus Omnitrophica bacterium]|nr:radical SAM protein [Candidatus Omnitrophota bacterium]